VESEQLLLHLAFQSTVRLLSIAIRAPRDGEQFAPVLIFASFALFLLRCLLTMNGSLLLQTERRPR
jgi:hypothetical protein